MNSVNYDENDNYIGKDVATDANQSSHSQVTESEHFDTPGSTPVLKSYPPDEEQFLEPHQTLDQHNVADDSLNRTSDRFPDPDSMKMFVGQIPRDWTENDCRQLLEPYGDIYQINILKDKDTSKSKGCCFVTYYTRKSALDAQNALHNLKKLPSCRNPIQMKPADNENKNDRKLFVGKLPKFLKEQDIMKTFSSYGIVEECIVLRDNNGQSKGCAFVTYSTRSSASNAIRALNQTKTLEGCVSPIVVKFADSNSNKDPRKLKAESTSPVSLPPLYPPPTPAVQSYVSNPALLDNSYLNLIKAQQQQLMSLALPQNYLSTEMAYSNLLLAGTKFQFLNNPSTPLNASKLMPPTDPLSIAPLPTIASIQQSFPSMTPLAAKFTPSATTKQLEGPDGANLFIYHLPAEYTDSDLINLFSPFGNVISAKVFIDKNSNLSKCFGFVSYDNVDSAKTAIKTMNGFQVLNKRLKVQPKKVRDKPY